MEREKAIAAILDYFKENEDVFNSCIEDLDSHNGYLGDDRYYSMDELSEFYSDTDPIELLQRAYYGWDEGNWTTDERGEKHHAEFNPNRDYFRYNGYGNLVSADYKDYSDHMDDYAVESMAEHREDIWDINHDPDLSELFDALEEDETEGATDED